MEYIQPGIAVNTAFATTGMTQKFHDKFHFGVIVKYPSGSNGAMVSSVY